MFRKLFLALIVFNAAAWAQTTPTPAYAGQAYTSLAAVTSTGPGTVYQLQTGTYAYTVTLTTAGVVSAAGANLEGSTCSAADIAANTTGCWFVLATAASTDVNWAAGEMFHVVNKPVVYIRLNLITFTGSGSITGTVTFFKVG